MKTRTKSKEQRTKSKEQRTKSKEQRTKSKEQRTKFWKYLFLTTLLLLLAANCLLLTATFAAEKWPGVDETVVEKVAREHGREARAPLINTDQGDLLLFVFLLAGAVGGFIGGYYWRTLVEDRRQNTEHRVQSTEYRVKSKEQRTKSKE